MDFKRRNKLPLAKNMPKKLQEKLDKRVLSPSRFDSRTKLSNAEERRQQMQERKSQRVVAHNQRVLTVQQKTEVGSKLRSRKLKRKSDARIEEAHRRRRRLIKETAGKAAANNQAALAHAKTQARIQAAAQQNILLKHVHAHVKASNQKLRVLQRKKHIAARQSRRVQERRRMQEAMDTSVQQYNRDALQKRLQRAENRRALLNQPIFSEENNARAEAAMTKRKSPTSSPASRTSTDSFDFSPQLEMMRRAHRAGKEVRDRILKEGTPFRRTFLPTPAPATAQLDELAVIGTAVPIYDAEAYDYEMAVEDTDSVDEKEDDRDEQATERVDNTHNQDINSASNSNKEVASKAHLTSQFGKKLLLFATGNGAVLISGLLK